MDPTLSKIEEEYSIRKAVSEGRGEDRRGLACRSRKLEESGRERGTTRQFPLILFDSLRESSLREMVGPVVIVPNWDLKKGIAKTAVMREPWEKNEERT